MLGTGALDHIFFCSFEISLAFKHTCPLIRCPPQTLGEGPREGPGEGHLWALASKEAPGKTPVPCPWLIKFESNKARLFAYIVRCSNRLFDREPTAMEKVDDVHVG